MDLSQIPSYFKGGTAPGSYVTITCTGQFQGNSLDGVTVTAVTGDDPDSLGSREITSSVSGTITVSYTHLIHKKAASHCLPLLSEYPSELRSLPL